MSDRGTAAADLAARVRARLADEADVIPMSDELIERVAGILSPVPPKRAQARPALGAV